MANLLTTPEKKNIRGVYRARVVAVAVALLAALSLIAVILLAPSYILSSFKYGTSAGRLADEKQKISDDTDGIDPIRIAKDVNAQLAVLGEEPFATPLPSEAFATIVGHKPPSVSVRSMTFDRDSSDGKIIVNGVSRDRKTLLSFLQALEGEPLFSAVELPISSFVEGEDIPFSIRVDVSEEMVEYKQENQQS